MRPTYTRQPPYGAIVARSNALQPTRASDWINLRARNDAFTPASQ
jgi:hypothetical protein